jgi:hypothetical protein
MQSAEDRRASIHRHLSALLAAYASLLASGRVGALDSEQESLVEATLASSAAASLRASVTALLDLCAALRVEAALLEK